MKAKKLTLLYLSVALFAFPLGMDAQNRRVGRSNGVNIDKNGPVNSCGDIHISYDRRPAIIEETETTLPASQISTLRAQLANTGIYITGWDRNEYSVRTCKAVPDDDPNPGSTLREITTNIANGEITLRGPGDREWIANLIVMVPRLSTMDIRTGNGPVELRDLAGNIQLNASNGPIGLVNVGGFVQATTSNGPISARGTSGDQHLTATNGPISVTLSGNQWLGPGLEATTRNGPMSLSFPDAYTSGIQVQTADHAPISCRAAACSSATRSLSSPSVIRIGNGNPVVRLSSMNGPVSIQSARD